MSKPRSKKRKDKPKRKAKARPSHKASARPTSEERATEEAEPNPRKKPHPARAWTEEAKREAVAILERGEISVEQLAAELGIGAKTLRDWQHQFEDEENNTPMTPEERRVLRRLEKENERLRMEVEILKKAATFFAKHRS